MTKKQEKKTGIAKKQREIPPETLLEHENSITIAQVTQFKHLDQQNLV